jgi:predicted secreted protein
MMPGEGYWDLVREQKEELARQEMEKLVRQEMEELARRKRIDLAFEQREAMLVQAHNFAETAASPNASGRGQKRKAVDPEIDLS